MQAEFIIAVADVYCKWTGEYPRYRCYVNDELFTERTWIWRDEYLEEEMQILAVPGNYNIRYELIDSPNARLKIRNIRVRVGPAVVNPQGTIQIYTPEKSS
jgi:hypothetical protein